MYFDVYTVGQLMGVSFQKKKKRYEELISPEKAFSPIIFSCFKNRSSISDPPYEFFLRTKHKENDETVF